MEANGSMFTNKFVQISPFLSLDRSLTLLHVQLGTLRVFPVLDTTEVS